MAALAGSDRPCRASIATFSPDCGSRRVCIGAPPGGVPSSSSAPAAGLGFERLPAPSPGDLFFDMEGDPLVSGGLEYLFGIYEEAEGVPRFDASGPTRARTSQSPWPGCCTCSRSSRQYPTPTSTTITTTR